MSDQETEELRDYATRILETEDLVTKLAPPPLVLVDSPCDVAHRPAMPGRPPSLKPEHGKKVKVPRVQGMQDLNQRVRILHALANHELQAVELFAWGIVAFPDTPGAYRRGLLSILLEEQIHCNLYIERIEAMGHSFGDFPVSNHLWNQTKDIWDPSTFICALGLTFENANLDFALEYKAEAEKVGDFETAKVLQRVHEDEIRHVAFSWRWHKKFSEEKDLWEKYTQSLPPALSPGRARGRDFDRAARIAAGIAPDFIDRLEYETSLRPNGTPR